MKQSSCRYSRNALRHVTRYISQSVLKLIAFRHSHMCDPPLHAGKYKRGILRPDRSGFLNVGSICMSEILWLVEKPQCLQSKSYLLRQYCPSFFLLLLSLSLLLTTKSARYTFLLFRFEVKHKWNTTDQLVIFMLKS